MAPVALITGAAHGIGRELALNLARDGYAIAALDCDAEALQALSQALAAAPHAIAVADVTHADELQARAKELESRLGPTSLVIASAGIGMETTSLDFRAADFEKVIRINLVGVANTIAAVLPGMIERRAGHIVALSSLASFRGLPRLLAYSTSKAAVNTLLEGMRTELRPLGIHVTTICPGWIRTRMTAPIADSLDDILELDAGVGHILRAIREKRPFYAFPARTAWRLRILRLLPRSWQDRVLGKMTGRLKTRPSQPAAP